MSRLVLALLLSSVTVAHAQPRVVFPGPEGDPLGDDLSRARELFQEGTDNAAGGRWADALTAFEQAYLLSGVAAALYNAATTLRSLGRYRDARDAFDQLDREHPELSGEMALSMPGLRREVAERVAILELRDLPTGTELRLRLDGTEREDSGQRPLEIETDSGRHSLRVEVPRFEPFLWEGRVQDGERREIQIMLEALPETPQSSSNIGKIILWTVVGLLVVGAAVTTGLLLREDGLSPQSPLVVEL